ncbi:MAG: ABC transporter substrate-binding protein [Nanoarchaeota archaeon]
MTQTPNRIILQILFILILSAIVISGCEPANPTGKAIAEPIKIGAVLSLTGFAQSYGEPSRNGILLAEKEINAAGGVNGRLIKVIFEDDGTSGKNAVTATQKLIDVDKVDAIIGGTWDLSLEPITPVTAKAGLIIINPSTGNADPKSRLSPNLFRTWPSIERQIDAIRPVMQKERIKNIALIRNSGPWALAHKSALERLLAKTGGKIVYDAAGPDVDNNDLGSEITKIAAQDIDAVFLASGQNDAANTIKKFKEQGFKTVLISSEGSLGTAIKAGLVDLKDAEGAYLIDLAPTDPDFIIDYQREYGKKPGLSADTSYNAVKTLARAYNATGTTDTETVRAYLQSSGDFDKNGDAAVEVRIARVS